MDVASVPLPASGTAISATPCRWCTVTWIGSWKRPVASARDLKVATAAVISPPRMSRRGDHDLRGGRAAGELPRDPVVGLHDAGISRQLLVQAELLGVDAHHGRGKQEEEGHGHRGRHTRPTENPAEDGAPHPALAVRAAHAGQTRGRVRGRPGRRAGTTALAERSRTRRPTTSTTRIAATANPSNSSIPDRNMPDMATHDRQPGHQHRAARRRCRDPQRRLRVLAASTLLALPTKVEHAVVDTDGQADEQHHRARGAVQVHPVTDHRQQTVGGEEGGQRQARPAARPPGGRRRRRAGCPSASGTAVHSARWKSLPIVSLNHLLAVPSPNSSIRTDGCACRVDGDRVDDRLYPVGGGHPGRRSSKGRRAPSVRRRTPARPRTAP